MEDQKKPKDTEAMILQAAEKEFLEKGYAGARTTAIAEAAGVTHAMLHYYFRTKDKPWHAVPHGRRAFRIDRTAQNLSVHRKGNLCSPYRYTQRPQFYSHRNFHGLHAFLLGESSTRSTSIHLLFLNPHAQQFFTGRAFLHHNSGLYLRRHRQAALIFLDSAFHFFFCSAICSVLPIKHSCTSAIIATVPWTLSMNVVQLPSGCFPMP